MENRFLEMNSRLNLLKRNGRSYKVSTAKSFQQFSSSFDAINYEVPGIVGPIRQPSGMVCWATVATMMISWRGQQSMSIETAIGSIGDSWLQKFRNNQGLDADEKIPFLNAAGFQFEYPQSLSIAGWEQLLRNFGPVWVTTDEDPSTAFAIHARIMSGIHGDGTPEGTFLKITDPARGNQYEEKFSDFLRKYEDEVRTSGKNWSGRIQIVHWPQADTSAAKSFSNERTTMSISQPGVSMIKRFEGFRPNLYNDPVGHCSVGYGELVHRGSCNGDASEQPYQNGLTEDRAGELLVQRLSDFQRMVNDTVTVELNQNQFDSLVSFSYNVGSANFRQSTLLRLLNQENYGAVPTELRKWTKGRVKGQLVDLPGLVNRRNAEADLFQNNNYSTPNSIAQSFNARVSNTKSHSYNYDSPSRIVISQSNYSTAFNPAAAVIAGVEVADAAQIGLGAISVLQSQVSASQGTFTLSYDKAQRLLTSEARAQMPGAQSSKQSYSASLLSIGIGAINAANANIIIEWEGNAYGEIGTPVIRRDLPTSSEWSRSSANITITKVDRIPLPNTDPRVWPIVYTYEGTYDPYGNGYFEFSGEFEVNAFGGLKFNRHQVVSRSFADFAIGGSPENKVAKGSDKNVQIPPIPQDQIAYLRTKLP